MLVSRTRLQVKGGGSTVKSVVDVDGPDSSVEELLDDDKVEESKPPVRLVVDGDPDHMSTHKS